eukprot:gene40663-15943_t
MPRRRDASRARGAHQRRHVASDFKPRTVTKLYAVKICDGSNPQEGKVKVQIDCHPPLC